MIDIGEGRLGKRAHRLALDGDDLAAADALDPHTVGGKLAVRRVILAEREQRGVLVGRDDLGGGVHGGSGSLRPCLQTNSYGRSATLRPGHAHLIEEWED